MTEAESVEQERPGDPPGFPLRAFWAWPVGFGLVGAVEATIQEGRIGGGIFAVLLATCGAACAGLWPGALSALISVLARRRGFVFCERMQGGLGKLAIPLVAGLVLSVVGWGGVTMVMDLFRVKQFDFDEDTVDVWRAAMVLGVPVAVIVIFAVLRRADERFENATLRLWVARVSLSATVVWALAHLCSGPFVIHFGGWLVLGLVLIATLAAASWLPAVSGPGRRGIVVGLAPVVLLILLGVTGLRSPVPRALLLHDTRVYPTVHQNAFAFLDMDGDGEFGAWAGGRDCDDGDPLVASWRPEQPGNGIDDNCRLGDAPPPELAQPVRAGSAKHLPVFLITLDTIRADRLELYGRDKETMPYLADMAERSKWFERAYSPSSHTAISIISMMSGQGPEYLIHEPEVLSAQGKKFTTWLPHILAQLGYETWAINPALIGDRISVEELRFENHYVGPFDYAPKNRGTRSKQVADWLPGFLESRTDDRPLFAWIHVDDAHARHASHLHFEGTSTENGYDNELRWVDLNLAAMLKAIEQRYGDQAIVIVTSDHGEEFGERGAYGHGFSLSEAMTRVPLVIRAPGIETGRVERPVNVAGVPSAVLELIGEPPSPRATVPSVLSETGGPVVLGCPFFWSEFRMEAALVEPRWKLIINRVRGTSVLFDLQADPSETNNVAGSHPDELERMETELLAALEALR